MVIIFKAHVDGKSRVLSTLHEMSQNCSIISTRVQNSTCSLWIISNRESQIHWKNCWMEKTKHQKTQFLKALTIVPRFIKCTLQVVGHHWPEISEENSKQIFQKGKKIKKKKKCTVVIHWENLFYIFWHNTVVNLLRILKGSNIQ